MDTTKMTEIVENFNRDLNDGLELSSLWKRGTTEQIACYNGGSKEGVILFDQISENIDKALKAAEFPEIDPYFLWKVAGNMAIGGVIVENIQVGIVVNLQKASLGLALNVAIPNMIEALKEEIQQK